MIYPEQFEEKIGFSRIRQLLHQHCISEMGAFWVNKLKFSTSFSSISLWLNQTEEMQRILLGDLGFPTQDFYDLRPDLNTIRQSGSYLKTDRFFDLKTSLTSISQILVFFHSRQNNYPNLYKLAGDKTIDPFIIQRIDVILDEKGEVKDSASEKLNQLRLEIRSAQKQTEKAIQESLRKAKKEGWAGENVEASLRDGRLVIPMGAAYKRQIKGIVHGESSTGQTVFVEPEQVILLNNKIKELEGEERREIIRILIEFADFLRPSIDDLNEAYHFLSLVDFIISKARLAIQLLAVKPDLSDQAQIEWYEAKHPLLYLSHKQQNKTIEPLDIKLNSEQRILLISGPNAGGKSVSLKTIGLLQYMIQNGLLVPMKSTSVAGIFKRFFIDIGDEQSIENDLSTYSSHLLNMKHFINNSNSETIFLIDEFGSGTEPVLGGAIAETILEELNRKKAFGVITTHYANLKLLPSKTNGMINGAMLFDTKNMQPLYKLVVGRPGSSFTIEIAKKIGFPKSLISTIEEKADRRQLDFEEQLQQLEVEKKEFEKKQLQFNLMDDHLANTLEKYQVLYADLQKEKKNILLQANKEAKAILKQSNKLIENTIKEIQESKAEKAKTAKVRSQIQNQIEKLDEVTPEEKDYSKHHTVQEQISTENTEQKKSVKQALKTGDFVVVAGQNTVGTITLIKGNKAKVDFNSMQLFIELVQLEKVSKAIERKQRKTLQKSTSNVANELNEKATQFTANIDVRGQRVDEALIQISRFIDDAILLGAHQVHILHGKGTGVLRQVIRDYLQGNQYVARYYDEHIERGGHGITVVEL
ncbi:MAG: Smr/MutS family protein [Bacteroidales bacterium]|nr:Smr/MutS family protein [Bacteroidales bacterium]